MTEEELSQTYESVAESEFSYDSIVEKADRLQAWNEGLMRGLDILNESGDVEEAKEKIFKLSERMLMTRYDLVFERMKRDLIF